MNKKIILPLLIIAISICGFFLYEVTTGNLEGFLFDQISYNYTSHVWIPPNSPEGSSLGGYYQIYGKGRDFKFLLVLPGAEKAESPLDYTGKGLKGSGRIDKIDVTYNTITALLSHDLKKAMFETKFSGLFNMSCAAWNGTGDFANNGQNFSGNFKIIDSQTDWIGSFDLVPENDRIAMISEYIFYPHNNKSPGNITHVKKTFYF